MRSVADVTRTLVARRDRQPIMRPGTMVFCALMIVGVFISVPWNRWLNGNSTIATAATVFAGVVLQAIPFLVLGTVVSAAIAVWVTPSMIARLSPRRPAAAICVGGFAGALLPGCECASVPVSARLMDRGVPQAAALAFLLSAPAINPVVLASTAVAFPGQPSIVVARCLASLLTALVMGGLWARYGNPELIVRKFSPSADEIRGWGGFAESMRHDFLSSTAFLVFGAGCVALLHIAASPRLLETLAGQIVIGILVMALLAVVLAVCSEADAFVAAGMSMLPLLPRLVFLVVGPVVDLKLIAMQVGAFGSRFAARFSAATFLVAIAVATAIGALIVGWR